MALFALAVLAQTSPVVRGYRCTSTSSRRGARSLETLLPARQLASALVCGASPPRARLAAARTPRLAPLTRSSPRARCSCSSSSVHQCAPLGDRPDDGQPRDAARRAARRSSLCSRSALSRRASRPRIRRPTRNLRRSARRAPSRRRAACTLADRRCSICRKSRFCASTRPTTRSRCARWRSRRREASASRVAVPDRCAPAIVAPAGIDVVTIAPLASREAYSQFVLKSLRRPSSRRRTCCSSNGTATWSIPTRGTRFLDCDYIGAKWFWHDDGLRVGNGGFSLRSRQLSTRCRIRASRSRRRRHDDRPHVPAAARARARDPLRRRGARRPLRVRGRLSDRHGRSAFMACSTSAASFRRPSSRRSRPRSPTPSRARRNSLQLLRNCVASGQWPAAARSRARILAADAGERRSAALLARRERTAAGSRRRPQRSVPLRQRQALQALPWRPRRRRRRARRRSPVADALVARRDRRAPARRSRRRRARLSRGARARARASDALHYLGVVLYQRGRSTRRCRCSSARSRCVPQEAGVPQQPRPRAGRARTATDDAIAAYRRALALKPDMRARGTISGSRCRRRIDCPGDRRVPPRDCARARFRAGALEPRARAARGRAVRRRLARIRMARSRARFAQLGGVARAALGRRVDPPGGRCS